MLEAICCSNNYSLIFILYLWRTVPPNSEKTNRAECLGERGWIGVFFAPERSALIFCCKLWEGMTPLVVPKRGMENVCVPTLRDRVLQLGTSLQRPGRAVTAMALPRWFCLQRGRQKSFPMNKVAQPLQPSILTPGKWRVFNGLDVRWGWR